MKILARIARSMSLSALLMTMHLTASIIFTLGLFQAVDAAEFFCSSGNVTCLIAAINDANLTSAEDTIFLEPGTYTLTSIDNDTDGPNGLPSITTPIIIRQNDLQAAIERDPGASLFRIFHVAAGGRLHLYGALVQGGSLFRTLGGAGFLVRGELTLERTNVYQNNAPLSNGGGGIANLNGRVTVLESSVGFNDAAVSSAGGIISSSGQLEIIRSSLFRNTAEFAPAIVVGGELRIEASSIYDHFPADLVGALLFAGGRGTILNTTFAANGGRNISARGGLLTITNSTFEGTVFNEGGTVELQNVILSNVGVSGPFVGCGSGIRSLGNNIIASTEHCMIELQESDLVGDPRLDQFAIAGELGLGVFPLLPDSPAIDSANPDACPRTDQLGLPRLGACDIGSIEFQAGRLLVSLDIRPRSDANKINPSSPKNINVAILSVNGFDATTVDPNTVRFGTTGAEAAPVHVGRRDVDGDGHRDMVVRFEIQDTGIKCGDTSAVLTGQISNGPSFIGSSPLTTVQCKKQDKGLIASGLSKK